ncbi:unnamed protein product [Durusdinium trenchii]|uniref:FAD/NAD(P)-binding domain-containing protein n=1 Tax=Durusdinium trenchii TaxID=1381693 RepID=A0ABP0P4H3_9DINO
MNKGPDAGARITYKALIVATGAKSPLIAPTPGMSLSERVKEVQACGQALKNAKTVIFNGSGLVGVEMCGDFRVHNGYGAKVILLSRSGKVLDSDPEARPETCQAALRGVNPKMLPVVFGVSFVKMT